MKRFIASVFAVGIVMVSGCNGKTPTPTEQPSPTATPAALVTPSAAAPSLTGPAVKGTIPALIPDRLRRPLTREEIMKLPPETRDMILRAQGRPLPSPTKKP